MATRQSQTEWIPDAAFVALAHAVTGLSRFISQKCGISLAAWLVLWCVRYEGKRFQGGWILLRYDLSRLLETRGFSSSNITKLLDTLLESSLITRHTLTTGERRDLFGSPDGSRLAILLVPAGDEKIEEFKRVVRASFDGWRKKQSGSLRVAIRTLKKPALAVARFLLETPPDS
jgi:DNA-binding MarR family transcriptional regulator